jgi:hypothetical protein
VRGAAAAIVAELLVSFNFATDELAAELTEDLEYRANDVDDLLGYLRESGHDLDDLIAIAEFGDKHAADDELLRLSDVMDPSRRAKDLGLGEITDDLMQEAQEAVKAYRARMNELKRTAPAETTVAQLADVRVAQAAVANGADVAAVLRAYYDADVVLTRLERYVGDAVSAYDDYIQQEIDRARGN